jgi:hypothetical protein
MRPKAQERGQALVIIALAVVGLFGFSALAIDGSRVFSDRRNAQNAADTAALSAALAKIRLEDYAQAAKNRAADNGYATNVEVALCNTLTGPNACQGIPTSGNPDRKNPANYIQVKITSTIPATFARIVGRNEFTNIMTAIAYAGPVEPKPLVEGNALAAMSRDAKDAIFGGGTMNVDVNNSGIFSNSGYLDAGCSHGSMRTSGTGTYEVDTSIQTVGDFCRGGGSVVDMSKVKEQVGFIDYPPDINIEIPNFSCGSTSGSSTETADTITYFPGNHGKINIVSTKDVIFSPGTYCFSNGVSMTGPDVIANNVRFLFSGGEFKVNGSTLTCNDMLVHIDGGSGLSFTGTSNVFCNNVTFIASTGNVTWNGAIENRMFAPTGGDYKGVLLYMPYPNDQAIKINGNSSNQLTGSIIGVASPITITGNDWTNGLNSQIIGNTINLNGNGVMVINYVPEEQFQQIDPSAIMLTK